MLKFMHFLDEESLNRFYTMLSILDRKGQHIGSLVKHLRLDARVISDRGWNALLSLLSLLPQLSSFEHNSRSAMPYVLRCLVQHNGPRLTSLVIRIGEGAGDMLFAINQLRALRTLSVSCSKDRWSSDYTPLDLEHVKTLSWTWDDMANPEVSLYLRKCRFAVGAVISLTVHDWIPDPDLPNFHEFLKFHAPERLALDVGYEALEALGPSLSFAGRVHYMHCVPPVTLFQDGWPDDLHISVIRTDPDPLYEFLGDLLTLYGTRAPALDFDVNLPSRPLRIHVGDDLEDRRFTWGCVRDQDQVSMMGWLTYYALNLNKHGVTILDSGGKTLPSLFASPPTRDVRVFLLLSNEKLTRS
jgi:hypothetical protein